MWGKDDQLFGKLKIEGDGETEQIVFKIMSPIMDYVLSMYIYGIKKLGIEIKSTSKQTHHPSPPPEGIQYRANNF